MEKAYHQRFITKIDRSPTFIGFGGLSIGRDWGFGTDTSRPEEQVASDVLNKVLDEGINLIDTASAYHYSEERIGNSISQRRGEYILSSKCGEHNDFPGTYYDFSYEAIKQSIDDSLTKLKTDVIDVMFIHFGPNPEKVIHDGETLQAMREAQNEGKINSLGASIDGELAGKLILSNDFDVIQMEYSLLNQANENNITLAKEKGTGVFIRGGLGKGLLTEKAPFLIKDNVPHQKKINQLLDLVDGDTDLLTSLALNFLYENDGINSVLLGTKNIDHFDHNKKLLEQDVDRKLLEKAIEIGSAK